MHLDGDNDKAIDWARKALELDPNDADALCVLGRGLNGKGVFDQAIEVGKKLAVVNPDWKFVLAESYLGAGRRPEALRLVAEMEREDFPKFGIFLLRLQTTLGNREEAFRALDAAFQYHHVFLPWSVHNAYWFPWPDDPRWQEYRRRLGFQPG